MIKRTTYGPVLALVLTLTSACTGLGGDQPPEGKDWFGNPIPTGPACDARPPVPRQRPLYDPRSGARPSVVPPGWSWIVITLQLRAVFIDRTGRADVNHCVPVRVHVHASQDGNPAPLKMNMGNGEVSLLPYDGVQTTPWLTSYFIFAYNPKGWKGPPPTYKIDFISTYDVEFDTSGALFPDELVCHIGIGGGMFIVESRSNKLARGRQTAQCQLNHPGSPQLNHYWAA